MGILGTHPPAPLPGALIRVRSRGRTFETKSDADGLFAFYGLPSGEYEFAPDLPPHTTFSRYIESEAPPDRFPVSSEACRERNVEVFASGSIQGRVVDSSNRIVTDATVHLRPVEAAGLPDSQRLPRAYQSKGGYFKFPHVSAGRYLLLVNPNDERDPEFPYRKTAAVITVRDGEQARNADIRLGESFAVRHLNVRVTWADGSPVRTFVFLEAKGTADPALESSATTDTGAGVLKLLANEPYQVQARLTCRYSDDNSVGPGETLRSSGITLSMRDDPGKVALRFPANTCPAIAGKTLLNGR